MVGIYKIQNLLNNKVYVGQSNDILRRWRDHKNNAFNSNDHNYNTHLYRSIRKYGLQNFSFEILEECSTSELDAREIYWISYYNSFFEGYNLTMGGDGSGSEVNKTRIISIIHELETTHKSHRQIAEENEISTEMVQGINSGRYWHHDRVYPIQDPKAQFYRRGFLCDKSSQQKKICADCGKEISANATRCVECEKERRSKRPSNILREDLKLLIRTKSFLEIGRMFGVSDNAIRKWCIKYNLPSRARDIKAISDIDWVNI